MLRAPQVMPHAGMSRFLMREETILLEENTGSYVEILLKISQHATLMIL